MDTKSLKLIKIQYALGIEALDKLLYQKMTEEEKKWTRELSEKVPNESIIDDYDVVHDILLVDEENKKKVEKMLNRLELIFDIYDISDVYFKYPELIGKKLFEDIDSFVKSNIFLDDVLDHINEVGLDNINEFEKRYLAITDGDDSKNTQ
jgi:hypothetical protein